MTLLHYSLVSLLIWAAAGSSTEAWAQSQDADLGRQGGGSERQESEVREWRATPPALRSASLSDAVRRVQRETGGQVLGAERVQFDGRDINRVKVLDRYGRVRYMDDDPQRNRESTHEEFLPRARSDNP
ncbi:MAG TPA: hypothetical protein VEY92_03750, partial [Pseudoxanthomonas sp.]|nr:hypothetical protein [Pseudoxanthomonas sp.]